MSVALDDLFAFAVGALARSVIPVHFETGHPRIGSQDVPRQFVKLRDGRWVLLELRVAVFVVDVVTVINQEIESKLL